MKQEILNLKQACEYLNCSRSHLYKLMENPSFPRFQEHKGTKLLFTATSLRNWISDNIGAIKKNNYKNVVSFQEAQKEKAAM